ncbi:MAG: ATP-binding protein, partial [Pseudomonadota bacterium]
ETIEDLQWELREREARYRDLLDHQDQVIARRDGRGTLSFVNDAFCRTFGIRREEVVGAPFTLPILDRVGPDPDNDLANPRQTSELKLNTAAGPRWFIWEEFSLPSGGGGAHETQWIGRDVTEQRKADLTLAKARDAAMAASHAKSQFLASMSHEIRTPMNGILGMVGLLLDTKLSPEQSTYARAISTSATTLLSLIDEVLDFSKVEAGKLELSSTRFDLYETAQGVVELLSPRARNKGLEIAWFIEPDLPQALIGDELRIRQVLMNLLGNAIKFTEQGGVSLTITAKKDAERPGFATVRFVVADTGPGIAANATSDIFSEFVQADQGPARKHGGTGLGLAISKKLVDAMGGRIGVKSELGKGATFTVELPLEKTTQAKMTDTNWPRPARDERILLVLDGDIEAGLAAKLAAAMGSAATCASLDDARCAAEQAAMQGAPYTVLLTDKPNADRGAHTLIPLLGIPKQEDGPRAVVLLDPSERRAYPALARKGFHAYIMRPARPRSLLTQLFRPAGTPVELGQCPDFVLPPAAIHTPHGLSILLAEDNEINALLAHTVLNQAGAMVTRVRDGTEAIAKVEDAHKRHEDFDLILMDIHMPEMDGIESAASIRALYPNAAEPSSGRPPIVALTANALPEDRASYLEAGLDDYLAKPFEKRDLEIVLARWLGSDAARGKDVA